MAGQEKGDLLIQVSAY